MHIVVKALVLPDRQTVALRAGAGFTITGGVFCRVAGGIPVEGLVKWAGLATQPNLAVRDAPQRVITILGQPRLYKKSACSPGKTCAGSYQMCSDLLVSLFHLLLAEVIGKEKLSAWAVRFDAEAV
jgi:hypothetical protein